MTKEIITKQNSESMITISKELYESLLRSNAELCALQNGGVDNWEWYHDSLKEAGLLDEEEDENE